MVLTFRDILLSFLIFLATSGVIGNTVVSLIYAFRLDKAKRNERFFLLVLALVDIVGCIFQGLHQIIRLVKFKVPGELFCCFLMFLVYFAVGASAWILLCIAIHRYRKICQPFQRQLTHIFLRRICLAITFVFSFGYSLPLGIMEYSNSVFKDYKHLPNGSILESTKYLCGMMDKASVFDMTWTGLGLILIILLSIVTVGLYIPVIYRTRQMFRKFRTGRKKDERQNNQHTELNEMRKDDTIDDQTKMKNAIGRLNKLCFVLALVNSVSYIPYCTIITLFILNVDFVRTVTGYRVVKFFLCIPLLQHAVNPFINILFDLELRKGIKNLFTSCFNSVLSTSR